jgi:hypothetical protein
LFFFSIILTGAGSPEFRVFPYENASLEPFETAVAALNPVVAVKVRSAAVHAALAEVYVIVSFSLTRGGSNTRFLVNCFRSEFDRQHHHTGLLFIFMLRTLPRIPCRHDYVELELLFSLYLQPMHQC